MLSESVSPTMIGFVLALIGAFLSLFSGAINAVYPMLGSLAIPYAEAAGINPIPLLVAIAIGACATAISPFSTGGAMTIANCPDEKTADALFMQTIILAILGAVVAGAFSLVGICAI